MQVQPNAVVCHFRLPGLARCLAWFPIPTLPWSVWSGPKQEKEKKEERKKNPLLMLFVSFPQAMCHLAGEGLCDRSFLLPLLFLLREILVAMIIVAVWVT